MANEKRLDLIDRGALISDLRTFKGLGAMVAETLVRFTEKQPTVDAVEVVRCKDCKHWHEETGWCYHHSHFIGADGEACHPWESTNWKMLNEDDFCSYGERKTT